MIQIEILQLYIFYVSWFGGLEQNTKNIFLTNGGALMAMNPMVESVKITN